MMQSKEDPTIYSRSFETSMRFLNARRATGQEDSLTEPGIPLPEYYERPRISRSIGAHFVKGFRGNVTPQQIQYQSLIQNLATPQHTTLESPTGQWMKEEMNLPYQSHSATDIDKAANFYESAISPPSSNSLERARIMQPSLFHHHKQLLELTEKLDKKDLSWLTDSKSAKQADILLKAPIEQYGSEKDSSVFDHILQLQSSGIRKLEDLGASFIIPEAGEKFVPEQHEAGEHALQFVTKSSAHDTVGKTFTPGLRYQDKVLRKASISRYLSASEGYGEVKLDTYTVPGLSDPELKRLQAIAEKIPGGKKISDALPSLGSNVQARLRTVLDTHSKVLNKDDKWIEGNLDQVQTHIYESLPPVGMLQHPDAIGIVQSLHESQKLARASMGEMGFAPIIPKDGDLVASNLHTAVTGDDVREESKIEQNTVYSVRKIGMARNGAVLQKAGVRRNVAPDGATPIEQLPTKRVPTATPSPQAEPNAGARSVPDGPTLPAGNPGIRDVASKKDMRTNSQKSGGEFTFEEFQGEAEGQSQSNIDRFYGRDTHKASVHQLLVNGNGHRAYSGWEKDYPELLGEIKAEFTPESYRASVDARVERDIKHGERIVSQEGKIEELGSLMGILAPHLRGYKADQWTPRREGILKTLQDKHGIVPITTKIGDRYSGAIHENGGLYVKTGVKDLDNKVARVADFGAHNSATNKVSRKSKVDLFQYFEGYVDPPAVDHSTLTHVDSRVNARFDGLRNIGITYPASTQETPGVHPVPDVPIQPAKNPGVREAAEDKPAVKVKLRDLLKDPTAAASTHEQQALKPTSVPTPDSESPGERVVASTTATPKAAVKNNLPTNELENMEHYAREGNGSKVNFVYSTAMESGLLSEEHQAIITQAYKAHMVTLGKPVPVSNPTNPGARTVPPESASTPTPQAPVPPPAPQVPPAQAPAPQESAIPKAQPGVAPVKVPEPIHAGPPPGIKSVSPTVEKTVEKIEKKAMDKWLLGAGVAAGVIGLIGLASIPQHTTLESPSGKKMKEDMGLPYKDHSATDLGKLLKFPTLLFKRSESKLGRSLNEGTLALLHKEGIKYSPNSITKDYHIDVPAVMRDRPNYRPNRHDSVETDMSSIQSYYTYQMRLKDHGVIQDLPDARKGIREALGRDYVNLYHGTPDRNLDGPEGIIAQGLQRKPSWVNVSEAGAGSKHNTLSNFTAVYAGTQRDVSKPYAYGRTQPGLSAPLPSLSGKHGQINPEYAGILSIDPQPAMLRFKAPIDKLIYSEKDGVRVLVDPTALHTIGEGYNLRSGPKVGASKEMAVEADISPQDIHFPSERMRALADSHRYADKSRLLRKIVKSQEKRLPILEADVAELNHLKANPYVLSTEEHLTSEALPYYREGRTSEFQGNPYKPTWDAAVEAQSTYFKRIRELEPSDNALQDHYRAVEFRGMLHDKAVSLRVHALAKPKHGVLETPSGKWMKEEMELPLQDHSATDFEKAAKFWDTLEKQRKRIWNYGYDELTPEVDKAGEHVLNAVLGNTAAHEGLSYLNDVAKKGDWENKLKIPDAWEKAVKDNPKLALAVAAAAMLPGATRMIHNVAEWHRRESANEAESRAKSHQTLESPTGQQIKSDLDLPYKAHSQFDYPKITSFFDTLELRYSALFKPIRSALRRLYTLRTEILEHLAASDNRFIYLTTRAFLYAESVDRKLNFIRPITPSAILGRMMRSAVGVDESKYGKMALEGLVGRDLHIVKGAGLFIGATEAALSIYGTYHHIKGFLGRNAAGPYEDREQKAEDKRRRRAVSDWRQGKGFHPEQPDDQNMASEIKDEALEFANPAGSLGRISDTFAHPDRHKGTWAYVAAFGATLGAQVYQKRAEIFKGEGAISTVFNAFSELTEAKYVNARAWIGFGSMAAYGLVTGKNWSDRLGGFGGLGATIIADVASQAASRYLFKFPVVQEGVARDLLGGVERYNTFFNVTTPKPLLKFEHEGNALRNYIANPKSFQAEELKAIEDKFALLGQETMGPIMELLLLPVLTHLAKSFGHKIDELSAQGKNTRDINRRVAQKKREQQDEDNEKGQAVSQKAQALRQVRQGEHRPRRRQSQPNPTPSAPPPRQSSPQEKQQSDSSKHAVKVSTHINENDRQLDLQMIQQGHMQQQSRGYASFTYSDYHANN